MEHAKKMVLVQPRVLEQLKDKESFEHEKLLGKNHSRPAEKKVTSASNLEIENILSDNTISDDQKIKMYTTALKRYLSPAKSLDMLIFAPVLGKLFKMGETAVITPPVGVEEKEAEKLTEDRIIKNIPKAYRVRAKRLFGHLKDYTGVSWNAKGEMVIDGKTLPGSNITVLVNDIIRKAKHEVDPVGRKSLVEQLSKTELPRGLIGNAENSRKLNQRKHKSTTPRKFPSKVPGIDWQILLNDIITLDSRVVSEAYPSPKDI